MLFDSREEPHIYYCRRCDSNEQGAAVLYAVKFRTGIGSESNTDSLIRMSLASIAKEGPQIDSDVVVDVVNINELDDQYTTTPNSCGQRHNVKNSEV